MQANRLKVFYSVLRVQIIYVLSTIVGVDYDEDPPVPISNTEVKLISADDTWLVTARENRYSPTLMSSLMRSHLKKLRKTSVFSFLEKF